MNTNSALEQIKKFKDQPNHKIEIIELNTKSLINEVTHYTGGVFNIDTKKIPMF